MGTTSYILLHNVELIVVIVGFLLLLLANRLPSAQGFSQFVGVMNSRGGNILILLGMVVYFTGKGIQLFYYALELIRYKQLTPDNAILLMGLTWITSQMGGGAMGALLKTMTGSDSLARASDTNGNGNAKPQPTPSPTPTNGEVKQG